MVYIPWILALYSLACTCCTWLSSDIFPNNAKLQRPIVPKCAGVSSSQIRITIISDFCPSDGANPMILVYSNMELQLLKHTSLSLAILTVIFGLPRAPSSEGLRSPNAPELFIAISTLHRLWRQHLQPPSLVRSSALKFDGEWFHAVGITY